MSQTDRSELKRSNSEDELLEQAALWLVMINSDECTDAEREAFKQWQQQDPSHVEIIKQLQGSIGQFSQLQQYPQQPRHKKVLEQVLRLQVKESSVWRIQSIVIFIGGTLLVALTTWQLLPMQLWLADSKNGPLQWREQRLSDHSLIKISGKTAFDIGFDEKQRQIALYQGNILVDVAKDSKRPFVVETPYARITALGTRFIVRQNNEATIVTMLSSKTKVQSLQNLSQLYRLQEGQQIIFNAQGLQSITNISPEAYTQAWQKRQLMVEHLPLDLLLNTLQSYQNQKIHFDATQLHDIGVNATLPLDGTALHLMAESLPIAVKETATDQLIEKK